MTAKPVSYPTESALQAACLDGLRKLGIWAIRMGVSVRSGKRGRAQSGEPGMFDLYLPGLGWQEVKQPDEKLSADQVKWQAKARRHGVSAELVNNVDDCLMIAQLWRDKWQEQQPSKSRN